ncbi:MAG: hypothetical protein ACRC33_02390 [Gemmataceae bacterium]
MSNRLMPPAGGKGVTVRMYRQGLGDAFLLAFPGPGDEPRYMLIDCGVHKSQTGGSARMKRIAADIAAATNGRLHVVVATHEHVDHLSGFLQGYDSFSKMTIDEVWFGWTEDREDDTANRLREKRGHAQKLIEAAVEKLEKARSLGLVDEDAFARLTGLADFMGLDEDGVDLADLAAKAGLAGAGLAAAGENPTGNEVAMALLRKWSKENVSCHRPGKCVGITDSARAYVLGPPLSENLLSQSDPAKGAASEVYLGATAINFSAEFILGAIDRDTALDPDIRRALDLTMPFDGSYRLPWEEARAYSCFDSVSRKRIPFFREHYGFGAKHELEWRRVGQARFGAIEELALNHGNDTNNTSLALAIELGKPGVGPVLLFPGDAQVGSWLSWKPLTWPLGGGKEVTMKDLFARTQLYKVGHHASHNGTLKADGLEQIGDDLIALIPVDECAAKKLKGWNMPYPQLYERLLAKSGGRVLRSDKDCDLLGQATRPVGLTPEQWTRFQRTVQTVDYYDVTIPVTS